MAQAQPPIAWEASSSTTHPTVSDRLPSEVVTCLQNARFLHLGTSSNNIPHVSLMNYTYLPSHPFPPASTHLPSGPIILMTTNPSSKKSLNLTSNPHVSLLVHDWVSSRPPASTSTSDRERSPTGAGRSSLAAMLMQMNSAAVSNISATINGAATVLAAGSDEERWCKEQHLANNTFSEEESTALRRTQSGTSGPAAAVQGDEGRGAYIEDDGVRVVVVKIRDGRISDWKGEVKDWVIEEKEEGLREGAAGLVNGV